MSKYLASIFAGLSIAVVLGVPAASANQSAGRLSALYPIPSTSTPASAAQSTAEAATTGLAALTPAVLAHKHSLLLVASASGPGTITVVLTAKIGGRTVVIGTAKKTTTGAGTGKVKLILTKSGKAALAKQKSKLHITVTTTFTPKQGKAGKSTSTGVLK
jgi:hypothetical protein